MGAGRMEYRGTVNPAGQTTEPQTTGTRQRFACPNRESRPNPERKADSFRDSPGHMPRGWGNLPPDTACVIPEKSGKHMFLQHFARWHGDCSTGIANMPARTDRSALTSQRPFRARIHMFPPQYIEVALAPMTRQLRCRRSQSNPQYPGTAGRGADLSNMENAHAPTHNARRCSGHRLKKQQPGKTG